MDISSQGVLTVGRALTLSGQWSTAAAFLAELAPDDDAVDRQLLELLNAELLLERAWWSPDSADGEVESAISALRPPDSWDAAHLRFRLAYMRYLFPSAVRPRSSITELAGLLEPLQQVASTDAQRNWSSFWRLAVSQQIGEAGNDIAEGLEQLELYASESGDHLLRSYTRRHLAAFDLPSESRQRLLRLAIRDRQSFGNIPGALAQLAILADFEESSERKNAIASIICEWASALHLPSVVAAANTLMGK